MATVTIPLGVSIQAAISANPAGTVFQLAAGTYRNPQFEPLAGDQFIGDASGGTVLSGAIVLNQWTQSGGYWVESGLPAPLVGQSVAGSKPLASDLNDLFINNVLYSRVSSLAQVTAGTWYFDTSTNSAYISDNPGGKTVEYSVTPNMTYDNGATGVVFQNVTIEKFATDAQTGPIQGGVDWHLNNVTSTQNHGAGLNIGAGTIVQGGAYVGNGQIGIDGYEANSAQILDAVIANNNYAGYNPDWDAGGIKLATSSNVVISGNNVYGNNGQGIWADIDSTNWTVSSNTVTNNAGVGIQYEISHGNTTIENNTLSGNSGAGVFISNSDGVMVSGNTVTVGAANTGNATATADGGIGIINQNRGSGPNGLYQSVNDTVTNNVIVHTTDSASDGIYYYQPISGTVNNVWSNNTYYAPNTTTTHWYFNNSPYTWSQLQQAQPYGSPGTLDIGLPPTPPPVISGPTTGSGADMLVLSMSEDAYQGDAQFTVSVDGQKQGGNFTVVASHAAGNSETFTFDGNWGGGSRTIAVAFLNDAYGGSPSTDRNLYVNDITYDGTNTGQSASLYTTSAQSFTTQGAPGTVITVPASTTYVTIAVTTETIDATAGNHMVLISGNHDSFNLSRGVETIVDNGGGGNIFHLPAAGMGSAAFNASALTKGDVFDLKTVLAATQWNGSTRALGSYLHTVGSGANTELLVSTAASRSASATLVATFDNQHVGLSTILAHALT